MSVSLVRRISTGGYRCIDTIPISPSRISQVAALGALKAGPEWVRGRIETLSTGREAILKALEPCKNVIGGSGAMYVMGEVSGDDQEFARKLLKDYGVAVIPGSFCGYPGWLRVCYANLSPETCLKVSATALSNIEYNPFIHSITNSNHVLTGSCTS